MPATDNMSRKEQIDALEELVQKFTSNLQNATETVAPMKVINNRSKKEPWKNCDILKEQFQLEKRIRNSFRADCMNLLKRIDWEKCQK